MSDPYKPPSSITSLSSHIETTAEREGALLNLVRQLAARHLHPAVGQLFEHVDDALFDLAEKAENNAAQVQYFDGMREVRKARPAIERKFLATVHRQLGELAGRMPAPPPAAPAPAIHELSLVAESELEESLAITSMSSKHEARLARDLLAIDQRLSVICGGRKIDNANNPVGPAMLSQAFHLALDALGAEARVKLIIYKLFERHVLSSLEALYAETNAELARAGVLAQLRPQVARDGRAIAPGKAPSAAIAGPPATVGSAGEATVDAELLQTLHELFAARRGASQHAALPLTGGGAPIPSINELLGALGVLQTQLATVDTTIPASDPLAGYSANMLKEQLLGQLGALRGTRPNRIASIDEDTIDLVGMLFEFILEDRTLPAQMQAMLARLQIPYLKVAILDRKLFAHRQHPARRLLDALAEQAKAWSPDSDRDGRLHGKIKAIVEQLLHEFDDDLGIFERLLLDLQQFGEAEQRRAELAEQRAAASTSGREKLEQARLRVAREIATRTARQHFPPLVHDILTRAWANHLVLVLLRQGDDSNEFRDGLRFMDELVQSCRPARDDAERQQRRTLLPSIERSLRQGLVNVAFQPQDVDRLLAQLHDWHEQQLGGAPTSDAPSAAAIPDSVQSFINPSTTTNDPGEADTDTTQVDSGIAPALEALAPGAWLEFHLPDEPMVRAKLSWISPMSGRYLFVNRRGLKVADYSPQELGVILSGGHARLLATSALFDRAMSAIVSRLREADADRHDNEPSE